MAEDRKLDVQNDGSPGSATLHGFFEASAKRFPNAIAIDVPPWGDVAERREFTYADIELRSNALAASIGSGLGAEMIVAILMDRSDEGVFVAQLATMKTGAAYLCLDPSFPDERLQFTLNDAAPAAVITSAHYRGRRRVLPVACRCWCGWVTAELK